MASDDSNSVITHEDEDDDQHHHRNIYSMSRLSMCNDDMMLNMSRLLVEEGSEGDADGELSDGKEEHVPTDDSDRETGWFSLPASPQQRRVLVRRGCEGRKEYGRSENERSTSSTGGGSRRRRASSSSMNMMMRQRERMWLERAWKMRKEKAAMDDTENPTGERPKRGGGKTSLCMDMEEIKACRDLGFDLKDEWTLEIPTTIRTISASTIDTDSGGNSPIATWRISSPGDDPRDVKARLKVWAQVVALTSASRLNG